MRRLREEVGATEPVVADGVRLLATARPVERSSVTEARVLARIRERGRRRAAPLTSCRQWAVFSLTRLWPGALRQSVVASLCWVRVDR